MPLMDGVEAVQEIIKLIRQKKVEKLTLVAVTANVYNKKKYLNSGFDFVVEKPVTEKDIKDLLSFMCGK